MQGERLDDFEDVSPWSAVTSGQARRGGIVVRPPLPGPIVQVRDEGGSAVPSEADSLTLRSVPARIAIECGR